MKLATSTGDFSWYVDSVTEKIRALRGTSFRYVNPEQKGKYILQTYGCFEA